MAFNKKEIPAVKENFTGDTSVLARRASRRPMDVHFWEKYKKKMYKKHAPCTANFQFLAKSQDTANFIEKRVFSNRYTHEGKNFHLGY